MSEKQSRQPRLLIISSDSILAELLSLEAQACGWNAEIRCFWSLDVGEGEYDAMLWDARGGFLPMELPTCPVVGMASEEIDTPMDEFFDELWQLPMRLSEVREFLYRSLTQSAPTVDQAKLSLRKNEPCLYWRDVGTVLYRNRQITLTEREWCVLMCLAEGNGQAISRSALQRVLGNDGGALNVHICHLRAKLEEPFGIRLVETVRGQGYRLRIPLKKIDS